MTAIARRLTILEQRIRPVPTAPAREPFDAELGCRSRAHKFSTPDAGGSRVAPPLPLPGMGNSPGRPG